MGLSVLTEALGVNQVFIFIMLTAFKPHDYKSCQHEPSFSLNSHDRHALYVQRGFFLSHRTVSIFLYTLLVGFWRLSSLTTLPIVQKWLRYSTLYPQRCQTVKLSNSLYLALFLEADIDFMLRELDELGQDL